MTMLFRYLLDPSPRPVLTLGGRWVRPRPIIQVSLTGPTATVVREDLLDVGSDDTVFPEWVAVRVGLDLSQAPVGEMRAVGGAVYSLRYAEVKLRATDGREFREWPATVGFTSVAMKRALLGFAGCLRFFSSMFRGDFEEVELTVNNLYPGT